MSNVDPTSESNRSLTPKLPTLTFSNWAAWKREFLMLTPSYGDAHAWLQSGKKPGKELRYPRRDDIIVVNQSKSIYDDDWWNVELFDPSLVEPAMAPIVEGESKEQRPERERPTTPAGCALRYQSNEDFIYQRHYQDTHIRKTKFKEDVRKMWVLLLNSAEQALQNKIKIHQDFNIAYNGGECDIGLLFDIMHREATHQDTQSGTLVQYSQLFSVKEDNDFDTYCTRMLDAVAEFASRMQAVDNNVVIPLFIHNLNKTQHDLWLKRWVGTSEALKPKTLEDVIASIRLYERELRAYTSSEVTGRKGQAKDTVEALAVTVQPANPTKTTKPNKGKGQQQQATNCFNCGQPDCPKGKKCKLGKSSYCKKCGSNDKWHKTSTHAGWEQLMAKYTQKRPATAAARPRASLPRAAPVDLGNGRLLWPVCRGPPDLKR